MFPSAADADAQPDALRRSPLFSALADDELATIARCLDRRSFPADTIIFSAGDPGDTCYIVETGEVAIEAAESHALLARLGPHAVVGEGCLLTDDPRTATARAVTGVDLLCFSRSDFDHLLEEENLAAFRIVLSIAAELHRRLTDANRRARAHQQDPKTTEEERWSLP